MAKLPTPTLCGNGPGKSKNTENRTNITDGEEALLATYVSSCTHIHR